MENHNEPQSEAKQATEIRYCPHNPWPKQQLFYDLTDKEAFYGGAAAGGKSEALLMAALKYIHVPGYAALILRKDTQRLRLSGGLMVRAMEWFGGTDAIYNASERRWSFPTSGAPATISFGYLQTTLDRYRYGSSEFQYIAFDELTEFPEEDYRFLFSRLRKREEIGAPLRMRSASNPGGPGHSWVLQRFIPDAARSGETLEDVYRHEGITYVPARIRDNRAVNEEEYRDSLSHLAPVDRERLMNGDWTIHEQGQIKSDWLLRYVTHDKRLELLDHHGLPCAAVDERDCRRFVTIDPAGTSAERAAERRGKPPSYTVIQVWDQPGGNLSHCLLLRNVVREHVGFDRLCAAIRHVAAQWRPTQLYIEREKLGQAVVDSLEKELPIATISPRGQDKVARAAPLLAKLERGEIWLPQQSLAWLPSLESEWLQWTGHPDETCDQIDAAAYAAILSLERSGGNLRW